MTLFNVNVSVAVPNSPNLNVQVEATDIVEALEAAKEPLVKSASASAELLRAALPSYAQRDATAPTTPSAK